MALILVLLCFVLIVLSIVLFKGEIAAPSFLLSVAFFVSSFDVFLNKNSWYFNNNSTVTLIVVGILSFILGCFAINLVKPIILHDDVQVSKEIISISSSRLFFYLILQLILYLSIIIYICNVMGLGISLSGLSDAIGGYYSLTQSGTVSGLPGILNVGQIINTSGIYYLLFLLLKGHNYHLNISIILYLNLFVGIIGSLLTGTKTSFFMYLVAFMILYLFLKNDDFSEIQKISIKSIIEFALAILLIMLGFMVLSTLQGRNLANVNVSDTISSYVGAPVKNLELFITSNRQNRQIFGSQTFADTYKWLYKVTGNDTFQIVNLYDYNWIFNTGLGNVYTLFMPLVNDFGYVGTYFVMFLLGCFCQICYNNAKFKNSKGPVNFKVIYYSYLSFAILFSFFSNKMFEMIFSRSGIYFIIGLYVFDFLLRRLSFDTYLMEDNNEFFS
ncbi:O-antigen polymerase [Companilactobacillus nodensis]|uniref:Oligosaccharide repeat unit polymerase n=1 Tax=Companilactobacillus nodensis DSM 19682 = JCM 14932 = NBRC 107160 TaxID=1423775 RepID=A0A0R1KGE5_9LACO|nr:O-antigen polymerase [Companilactobacillus nodensis]KRK79026.1 hypothetical protein FD03_GL001388 [Companilactobacillus nodensis DSM 19682 = JCM 14932 = NBRC 107160]